LTHGIEANTRNGLGTFTRALYDEAKVKGFSAISMRNDLKANFLLGESESKPLSERRVVPDHVSVIEAVGLSPRPYPRCTNTVGLGRFSLPFPKEWQHSAVLFEPTHEDCRVVRQTRNGVRGDQSASSIQQQRTSSKQTSGPSRCESALAHTFRVARDSGIILWKAKMYFRIEFASTGQPTRRRFCNN